MSSVFDKFKKKYPHIKAVKDCNPARHEPDTLERAREKVIDKLLANKKYIEDSTNAKPDKVYKRMADGTYGIGVKYGNRYLKNIFDEDRKMLDDLNKADLPGVIDDLVDCVKDGDFDDAIKEVMASNLAVRRGQGDDE